jgi:hypothetical protein
MRKGLGERFGVVFPFAVLVTDTELFIYILVIIRSFAQFHSRHWMRLAFQAALMLSPLVITEVVRGELSLLIKSLRSLWVGQFLVEGALGMDWVSVAAVAGFAAGVLTVFLGFLNPCAHVGACLVAVHLRAGRAGGGEDSKVDFVVLSLGRTGVAENPRHSGDKSLP